MKDYLFLFTKMVNECLRLKLEVLEDLLQSTTFSPEEITYWYKIFMRDYPRGQITLEEFKKMYQNFFLYGDSSKYAEHVFRSFDTNCDGIIDFKEYINAMYVNVYGTYEKRLKWTFTVFDIDGDGYISPEEMTEVVRSLYKIDFMTIPEDVAYWLSRKRTAIVFRFLDTNFDGRISLHEFVEGAKRNPSVLGNFQCETPCLRHPLYFITP